MALAIAMPWVSSSVYAACTPNNPTAGATVTCTGVANPLAPSYSTAANNVTVNVQPGASAGVLLGLGGTAMSLTGNNVTFNNAGTVDPSLLGLLGLLSSGTFIGNGNASTVTVNNAATGVMNGTSGLLGVSINGLTGMALAVQNGTGGVTNIRNDGSIGSNALLGISLIPSDAPVTAVYGGGSVNFVNTGTITGRVAFQASATPGVGNTFANSGTINGGVSMGAGSTNTFTAVSGSSVNLAGGIGLDLNVLGLVGVTLGFAPTGVVDGGAGGDNTLVLQNVLPSSGTGTGTGGAVTTLSSGTYINFQHLLVNSGTWNLQGPLVSGDATLNGGLVNFDNGGVFGASPISANGGAIAASTGGLTVANNVILGTGGLTAAGTNNFTLSGVLSGTGGLTQSGSGILSLTGANIYTGGTIVSAGTLALSGGGSLLPTGSMNLSGATSRFDISAAAADSTLGSLTGVAGSQLALGAHNLTVGDATSTTFAGAITGTGGLVKQGAGTLTLSGVNTYSGGTNINAGILALSGGDALAANGAVTIGATSALDISGSSADQTIGNLIGVAGSQVLLGARTLTTGGAANSTFAGIISGSGGLVKQGAGTLTLSGANTYSGGTTVNAGALQGDTTSLQGNIADNASLIFNQAANGTFAGVISGTGALSKQGAGVLTLSGANTYSGGTTIGAGTLQGDTASLQGNIVDNAALVFNQAIDGSFAGAISGTGSLNKQGAGTLTLSGTNTYTGGTTIGAGTLQGTTASLTGAIVDNAALVFNQATNGTFVGGISGAGSLTKLGTGTVTLSGANSYSGGTVISAGALQGDTSSLQGNITDDASLIFGQAVDGTFASVVSGTGNLIKQGAGTLTLTGTNTYSGGTTISAGALQINTGNITGNIIDNASLIFNQPTDGTYAGAVSGTGRLTKTGVGTLTLSGANTYSGGTTISAGALQGDTTSLQGNMLDNAALIFAQNADGTFTGAITGTGTLTKQGAGTLTLNGANSYSGGTIVSAGTLQGDSNSLQGNILDNAAVVFNQGVNGTYAGVMSGTGSLTKDGAGTLILGGANTYAGGTTISAGALQGDTTSLQGNIVDNASLVFDQTASGNFAGVVSGSGSLVKQGAGTLTLSGANSYTGATQINAGTLALAAGSSLASSSGVDLTAGSTLDLSAAGNQTLGVLGGAAGTINIGANTLTLNGAGNGSFGGVIDGTGALIKQGGGTQTLTGANLYTGGTTITGGTLALGAGGSLAAGSAVTLGGTGTLDLSTAGNQSIANLSGTSGQIQLGGGSALTVDSGSFAGAIAGNGGLIKTGAGALVLDGSNTYTGATQVVSGSLVIGSDVAHATAGVQSDVTVATTGSLGGFGHVDGNVDVQAGGHLSPGNPTGSFTVNGNLTLDQGSQLDFAFGAPGANANTPGQSHSVQVNGNLSINGTALNPTDAGGFGPGLYNLFNYTGSLTETNGGITAPVGYSIQNLTGSKQINLINAVGLSLNFWNANGLASATQLGGGSGVWSQVNPNWTDATGSITAVRAPADSFVIFGGAPGTVTVDNAGGAQPVTTQGIQFASDGYLLNGDALGLVAATPGSLTEVRVGDGSTASAGWFATIDNVLTGNGLQKTGAGTLILNGANTYTQGTELSAGVLSVSSDANLGAASDNLDFEGGTLQVTGTAFTSTPRTIVFGAAGGGFDIADAGNTFTVNQALTGTGSLTKSGDGTLVLSGANTYSGGTTIGAGTLQGDTTSLQGNIADNASLIFDQTANGTYAGVISGTGDVVKQGGGTLTFSGANTYTGSTGIDAGTLALGAGSSLAASSGINLAAGATFDISAAGNQTVAVLNGGGGTVNIGGNTLTLDSAANGSFAGVISGSGALVKDGSGTQTLTGGNLYTGGTTVNDGTLVLGAGGSLAAGSALSLSGNGTFDVSAAGNQTVASLTGTGGQIQLGGTTLDVGSGNFAGVIAGTGGVTKSGSGALTLNGVNTYTGATQVTSGSLIIGGDAAHASASVQSDITVASTGSLGGFGQVNGDLDVQSGGHLAPGNPVGSFTVNGNVLLEQGSQLDFSFGAPGANINTPGQGHSVQVNGNLTINGATLNPLDAGGFGPGLYNLFNYTGTLTEANGGIVPPPGGYTIQNLTGSKQINLITTAGMDLNFWNANGLATNSQLGGGSGVWSQANANWTDATGSVTATREPANAFVIFGGAPGTVTVDDAGGAQPVTTLGIQFASDGYHLNGDAIGLTGTVQAPLSEIRVGDGSSASAGWTATIDNVLTGNGFNKTGAGTLVLNGASTYTQSTELSAGVLSVSSDANLGAASANLDFEGGTLRITGTAFTTTARAVTLGAAGGGVDIADAGNAFTLSSALSGSGGLTKLGDGTLILTGANSYTGGTTISAGTLQGNSTSLQGNIADNAALVFDQATGGTFVGSISGSGAVTKQGAGTLILNGTNSYGGGTTISAGALQGDSASLQGNIVDNAALIFDQAGDGTFTGAVSGSGSLTKQGAGMLTLNGTNSYSGGTTISAGTLAGTTSSLQGDITDNATLAFNQTSDGTFAGTISGSGSLIKQGAATLTVTGANTYSGGTTISAGTLQGNATSLQGNIVDNATLAFDQPTDGSFAGAISGAGAVVKQGAGVLTLSGANSYSGGTTISAGTLQGNSASLQGNIADNAALVFDQGTDGSFAGAISGAGTVTKQGAGTLILSGANSYTGGTVISAGTLQGDTTSLTGTITDNAALVFNQNSDGAFNGSIGGTGSITKQGSGALTLNGNNPSTGTVTVQSGMLIVGDAGHANATLDSNVVVNSGATLSGIGTIGGLDLQGTIMPSSLTDPLNVSGNALLRSGSTYQVSANAAGQSSLIAVAGTVTIQGGTALALLSPGNYKPTTEYTIITGGQGVSGTFASVQSSLTFLTPTLSYTANAVNLSLQRNAVSFVDIANTHNEKNTATGMDGLTFDNPVYSALTLLDPDGARRALNELSGEVHASTQTALFDSSSHIRSAVNQHLQGIDYGGQTANGETHDGVVVWTTGWGHWDDHDGDGNASHMQSNGSGLVVGADLPLDQTRLGVLVARGQDSTRVDSLGSDTNAHSTYAGFYGNSEWGAFRLRGAVIYAWQDIRGHRSISFPGFSQSANSDYDAHTAQAYLEGSYVIPLSQFTTLEPYVNLARVQVHTDGFREQGGAADLDIDAATANQTIGTLGLRSTTSLGQSGLRGYAGIGWQHAWGDTQASRNEHFVAGGPGFNIQGVAVASNAGVVDLGLRMPLGSHAWIDASYFGQFASHANDQSARLTLTVSF